MAPNKRKILEAARKFAQKGNKDRALKEYEKLVKLDPRDAKLRLEIGDAHRRWGQVEEAVAAYAKVAEQYMNEGFDARAVAVYKQIQSLDPDRFDSFVPLADLYQRMGLASEAIQALQTAADGFHKQGKKREALELLRKMATLDPSNTTSRIKVADLLRQEGMEPEAIDEYEAARAELERQGEQEAEGTVLERILEIDPRRVPTLTALAQNLLSRGFAERAEPFAKRAVEIQADETSHLELLADIYRTQQRDDEMSATYRSLADLYRQRGEDEKAREIIQRFAPPEFSAPLEPDTGDVPGVTSEEPTLLDDDLLQDGDALAGDEVSLEDEAADFGDDSLGEEPLLELDEEMPTAAQPELDEEEDLEPIEGDPEQLLAEASVYLRYGKRAQAIRNLEAILEQDPGHRGALEKLGEAHADAEDSGAAVDAWRRAADCARDVNDLSGFGVLRDRIAALDPEAADALGAGPASSAEEDLIEFDVEDEEGGAAPPQEVAQEFDLDEDIEIDVEEEPSVDDLLEDEVESTSTTPEQAAAEIDAGGSAVVKQKIQEELDEAEFYHQQGLFDEARAIYERVLEAAPSHPLALVRMGEIEAAQGHDPDVSAPPTVSARVREEPPTVEERPALDFEVDLDAEGEDWTDGDLDDDLGLDARASDEVGELPDTLEIEVELPDADLAEPGLDAPEESPVASEPEAPLLELTDSGLDLPEVDLDAPELEASASAAAPAARGLADDTPVAEEPDEESFEDVALQPPVAVDVPDELVAESLAADAPGERFDDLLLEANADEKPDNGADSFDLAAELADAFDENGTTGNSSATLTSMSEQDVFSAVFSEFKKGVDKTLGEGDHEARYDLGIAYREMGLLDDALSEFKAASTSPERRVDCLQMMGLCEIDLGRAEEATVHLQTALDTPQLSRQQGLGLRFELGRAFEVMEDLDRAREVWQAVAAVDPTFCEVEQRLASLGQEKPEPDPEGFESFDDLFEDDDDDTGSDSAGESFDDLVAEANADDPLLRDDAEDSGELSVGDLTPPPPPQTPEPAAPVTATQMTEPAAEQNKPRRRKKKISFV